ncbi:MAG: galactose oxidase [Lentisphaeria bacterium]|nr:galactose oxidase [Lentisphaeria bacterium]NQZ66769.1 galactose oxidase [Lentisphaeria bacterium]
MPQIIGPNWKLETEAANWEPRDSCAEYVFDNHMWIMGGWFDRLEPNPRDVWKSPNGKDWEKVCQEAPWEKSDLPAFCVFQNQMIHMGGRSLPGTECSNEVYATTDGANWNCLTHDAGWRPRLGGAAIEFNGKLWLFGGTASFYEYTDETLMNDIWSSPDGINWSCESESAPWSARAYHKAVEFNNALYLIGGGAWEGNINNDVWRSEDGVNWACIQDSAAFSPRIWHGVEVYRDHIWVLAGDEVLNGRSANVRNDVWFSKDGIHWQELKSETIFSERHEVSTWVFDNKLFLGAGHALPLSNEVWCLSLPTDFGQ